jgi:membrane protein implicated in regulation of membrane protease activity
LLASFESRHRDQEAVMYIGLLVAWVVIGIAALVLRPFIPAWISFALAAGLIVYGIVRIVADGPNLAYLALVAFFALGAVLVWWRDIRGTDRSGRRPPPGEP